MRIGSKLVLILLLFPFTCLAQVKGKVVSVSDSTSMPSANFSLEKELKDVVVVADMVSRNASKETIFITDSLRKGTVQTYGDNRVNAFVALISVKYSLGKGKTTKLNNSKNLDVEK